MEMKVFMSMQLCCDMITALHSAFIQLRMTFSQSRVALHETDSLSAKHELRTVAASELVRCLTEINQAVVCGWQQS